MVPVVAANMFQADTAGSESGTGEYVYVAEYGSKPYSGEGQFNRIAGVAVDAAGNVYVSDSSNHRIQKYDSFGNLLATWGSRGRDDGQFEGPTSLAVDAAGNVYVVDIGNSRIQKFTSDGTFIMKWGTWGSADGPYYSPIAGITVDESNNVYITYDHKIQKFDGSGNFLTEWGSYGPGEGQFQFPTDIAIDSAGNVYVAEDHVYKSYCERIQKFSSSGNYLGTVMDYNDLPGFFRFAMDTDDNIYITDYLSVIRKYDNSGNLLAQWGSRGSEDGQFLDIGGIAFDDAGNAYVADTGNYRIQKFDSSLAFLTKWGSHTLLDEEITYLRSCVADRFGNVYALSCYNVTKFDSYGNILTRWGSEGSDEERLYAATDIAIDPSGNVYVAGHTGNAYIKKYDGSGNFLTRWEVRDPLNEFSPWICGIEFGPDGNLYVLASHYVIKYDNSGNYLTHWGSNGFGEGQIHMPKDIAVDSSGNVYVGESDDSLMVIPDFKPRIQKFDSSGNFLNQWYWEGEDLESFFSSFTVDFSGNMHFTKFYNCSIAKFDNAGNFLSQWGSYGSGEGQFIGPSHITTDHSGNLYVVDDFRVQKFAPTTVPGPIAALSADRVSGPAPLTVQFTDLSLGNPDTRFWKFGDGGTSTDTNPEHTYTDEGYYDVTLTVSNANGKDSEVKTRYIAVFNDNPQNEFDITAYYCVYDSEMDGTQTVTKTISGNSYTLKASFLYGGYGVAMQGTGRTGPTGDYIHCTNPTSLVFVHINNPAEFTDEIRQRYTDLGITDFTGFGNLAVNQPDLASFSVVSGYTGAAGRVLEPWQSVAVDRSVIPLGTTGVLLFKNGKTTPDGASSMVFRADDTGGGIKGRHIDLYVGEGDAAIQKWWEAGGNGKAGVSLVPVQVKSADFTADVTSGTAPLTVRFTDRSAGNPSSYLWDFGDDEGASTEPNPSHTYTEVGTFEVSLTVKGAYGSDTKSKYIEVFPPPEGMVTVSKSGNVDDATKDWKYPTHYDAPVFRRGLDNPTFVADINGDPPKGHHILFEIKGPKDLGCIGSAKTTSDTQTWKWIDTFGHQMNAGEIPVGVYHVSGYVVNNNDDSIRYSLGSDTFYVIFDFDNTDDGVFITREEDYSFSADDGYQWTYYLHQSSSPLIWQTALAYADGATNVNDAIKGTDSSKGLMYLSHNIADQATYHHLSNDERDPNGLGWNHNYDIYSIDREGPCKIVLSDDEFAEAGKELRLFIRFVHKNDEGYWAGVGSTDLIDGSNYRDSLAFVQSDFRPYYAPSGKEILEPQLAYEDLHPVGVCDDYAMISVAYLRSVGIPAKLVNSITHGWANYYDPDENQWEHIDATWNTFDRSKYYRNVRTPEEYENNESHYRKFSTESYNGNQIQRQDIRDAYKPNMYLSIGSYNPSTNTLNVQVTYLSFCHVDLLSTAQLVVKRDNFDGIAGKSNEFTISPGETKDIECTVDALDTNDLIYVRALTSGQYGKYLIDNLVCIAESEKVRVSSLLTSGSSVTYTSEENRSDSYIASFPEPEAGLPGTSQNSMEYAEGYESDNATVRGEGIYRREIGLPEDDYSFEPSFSPEMGTGADQETIPTPDPSSPVMELSASGGAVNCIFAQVGELFPGKESEVKILISNEGEQLTGLNATLSLTFCDSIPGEEDPVYLVVGSVDDIDLQASSQTEMPIAIIIPEFISSGDYSMHAMIISESSPLCDSSHNVTINPNYNIDFTTPANITIGVPFKGSAKISNADTNTLEDLVVSLNLHNKFNMTEPTSKSVSAVQPGESVSVDWNITPVEEGASEITIQVFSSAGSGSKSVRINPLSPPELFIECSPVPPVREGDRFVLEVNVSNRGDLPTFSVSLNITTPENATASPHTLAIGVIESNETENCAITIDSNETEDYTIVLNASSDESTAERIVIVDVSTPGIFVDILQEEEETARVDPHTGVFKISRNETKDLTIYLKNSGDVDLTNLNIVTNGGFTKQLARLSEGSDLEIPIHCLFTSADQGMLNVTVSTDEIEKNFSRPYVVEAFSVQVALPESEALINTVVPVQISVSNDVPDTKFSDLTVTSTIRNATHEVIHNGTTISLLPLEVYNAEICWDTSGSLPGNYTATTLLTIQGKEVAGDETRIHLIDNTPPIAAFTVNRTSGTPSLAVQFTDTSSGNPTNWSWTFGDGATSTDQNPTHTYTSAGTYTVNLTASNAYGSDEKSVIDYITVRGTVSITASGGGNATIGDEITLSGTNTDSATTYLFLTGPGLNATGVNLIDLSIPMVNDNPSTFTVVDVELNDSWEYRWDTLSVLGELLEEGTYTIYAVSAPRDGAHLSDAIYATATVRFQAPTITATASSATVAWGDELLINGTATGNPPHVQFWIFGPDYYGRYDGALETQFWSVEADGTFEGVLHTDMLQEGQYYVVVQHPVDYDFGVMTDPATGVMYGEGIANVTLTNLQPFDAVAALIDALDSPGVDDIYATLNFEVINPAPQANFTANVTAGVAPLTVQFTDISTGDVSSWLWAFGDGVTSAEQNPVHTYTVPGTYTVNLTVSTGTGSAAFSRPGYITVTVKGDVTGDGIVDISDVSKVAYMVVGKAATDPAADFNGNGAVDIGDAAKIAYYFVEKIGEL